MKATNSIGNINAVGSNNKHKDGNTITSSNSNGKTNPTSPICRCRVMYLGSSVPHITKDGLQGIQEPLTELYPDNMSFANNNAGIDSWLSVWSNGVLIENVDEHGQEVKRFFHIEALHYCAAVKYMPSDDQIKPYHNRDQASDSTKFLPLDVIATKQANSNHPPVFACILRRTTGIKVLECHAFICKREAAANALVRCCFHAYADTMYAKQINSDVNNNTDIQATKSMTNNQRHANQHEPISNGENLPEPMLTRRSKSIAALNEAGEDEARRKKLFSQLNDNGQFGQLGYDPSTFKSVHSARSIKSKMMNEQLLIQKQKMPSKSMHHIPNQNYDQVSSMLMNNPERFQAIQGYNVTRPYGSFVNHNDQVMMPSHQSINQPFYNPYAARVPSYPPHPIVNNTSNGGTLKSIKSLAANSIATTLLKSKKHAKAMSNQAIQQRLNNGTNNYGHQLFPPVPAMFLPNSPLMLASGSQTLKLPSKSMIQTIGQPQNFEAMTQKEMKKLLKKSAKYGLDASKFAESGLPLIQMPPTNLPPPPTIPPPIPPPQAFGLMLPTSRSGTMASQHRSMIDPYNLDMTDMSTLGHQLDQTLMNNQMQQPRPILVKPNSEFLKSKAGKKWLKQQKEFKKLLPPNLAGLPIVFGPPPPDALEPAFGSKTLPPSPVFFNQLNHQPSIPHLDLSGYYGNPQLNMNGNGRLPGYSPNINHISDAYRRRSSTQQPQVYDTSINLRGQIDSSDMSDQRRYHSDESSLILANSECSADIYRVKDSYRGRSKSHSNQMVERRVISLGDENDLENYVDVDDDNEDLREAHIATYESANDVRNSDIHNGPRQSHYKMSSVANQKNRVGNSNGGDRHYEQLDQRMIADNRKQRQTGTSSCVTTDEDQKDHQQFYNVPYDNHEQVVGNYLSNGNGIGNVHDQNGYSQKQIQQRDSIHDLSAKLETQLSLNQSHSHAKVRR